MCTKAKALFCNDLGQAGPGGGCGIQCSAFGSFKSSVAVRSQSFLLGRLIKLKLPSSFVVVEVFQLPVESITLVSVLGTPLSSTTLPLTLKSPFICWSFRTVYSIVTKKFFFLLFLTSVKVHCIFLWYLPGIGLDPGIKFGNFPHFSSNFAIIAALFPGSKYNLLGSGVTLPKTCLKGSTISPSKSTIKVLVPLFFTLNLYLIILSNGSKTKGKGSKFISKVSIPDIFFP